MPSFEEFGLREELLHTLEDADVTNPTALQEAVIPALRRGGNLVARASSGSGKTLAYTLGVLDRFAPVDANEEAALRLIVVTPDVGESRRVAAAITHAAQALGLQVAAPAAAWGTALDQAGILVGPAPDIMEAVRSSAVKFETVESIVIDGASTIASLGHLDQVDGLLDLIPRDAQRVLISAALTAAVEDLVDRRVKRALRYPSEPAIPARGPTAPNVGAIGYVVTAESTKLDLLAEQLTRRDEGTSPPIIFCRNDERAADLAEALSIRGFVVGQADDTEADVAIAAGGVSLAELTEGMDGEAGQTISHDIPGDAATLRARHAGDDDGIVLLEPRELAHLQEIARQAHMEARSTPQQRDIPAHSESLEAFREGLRSAITTEDLNAQFLVLAPLLEEFTAAEVAAAASALLRSRRPSTGQAPKASTSPATSGKPGAVERSAPTGPAPVTWARLFVGIGSRDEVRPGDLVGTLAGESGVPGSKIGKIEIRDSFSVVEVQADVADQVIQAVNGTTFKGRSVRVDYDRGGPTRRPPTRGGAAPRRTTRKPPRE